MPQKYNVWENAGSVGSFMFYHPAMDIYLIGDLNQFRYAQKGIKLMFKMIDILSKCNGITRFEAFGLQDHFPTRNSLSAFLKRLNRFIANYF